MRRDWLAARARTDPTSLALVDASTGTRWTYEELDAEVSRVAGGLEAAGVEPGHRVGVVSSRDPRTIALIWAVLRSGAVLAPLEATAPPRKLGRLATVAGLDQLVVETERESEVPPAVADEVTLHSLADLERNRPAEQVTGDQRREPGTQSIDVTRILLFTSGTTGEPKAVRLTPRNVGASAAGSAFRLGVGPNDRWVLTLPLYHMGGLAIPLRSAIYGTAVVLERDFDADGTAETVATHEATGISLVPTMLRRLLDAGWSPEHLRFALVGGAPTPEPLAERALEAGVPLHTTYGMTETASQVATSTPEQLRTDPSTVGRPLRTVDVAILDGDGARLGPNEEGEIVVSGPVVSPGYLDEDDSSFDGGRFHTGDLGYRDEGGSLHVTGRQSAVIITGGENVPPARVEAAFRALEVVEDVAAVGLPDPDWGQRVAVLAVTTERVDADSLEAAVADDLASHEIPKTIAFASEIPRTRSGTVDRAAVRDVLEE